MIIKKHKNKGRTILAVCDSVILGKEIVEGKLVLDLTSDFYKGEETSEEVFKKLIEDCYIINAVGKKTVEFLVKNKIISKDSYKTIDDVPYVQVVFEEKKD